MISERTIEIIGFMFRITETFHVTPLCFDQKTCRISEVRNDGPFSITIWRPLYWSLILLWIIVIISSIFLLVTDPIPPMHEIVVTVCIGFILCVCIVVLYTALRRTHDVVLMMNRFFMFDETFRKRFRVKRVARDGTEWVMTFLVGILLVEPFFEFPAFLLMTLKKWKLVTFFLSFTGSTETFLVYPYSACITVVATINGVVLLAFAFTAVSTQNTAVMWLKERNSKASLTSKLAHPMDSEILYRSLQLLHGEITTLGNIAAPATQILTTFILIIIPSSTIKFWRWLDRYTTGLLIIIAVTFLVIFFLITTFFSYIQEHSKKFKVSHRHLLKPSFLRSCQPLRWKMGNSYYITRSSFLTLLKNFVIKAIIKLIITF